ncbi:LPXTG cell wall anchor domain-containing protein [Sutcliffiella deserti]|uniref:LPXTG cell wall anchor domain-containing protein n=1 Tax=Sutcliffiella deserti TaxID=2875501 RepID=UPI001CBF94F5|nr:LPXTG cell wall anchor domain-containing protein [Sutcliffiella deserti]
MKRKSKLLPITLSTSLVLFSFGALPVGATNDGDDAAIKDKVEEVAEQALENENTEPVSSENTDQEELAGEESEEVASETEEDVTEAEQVETENDAEQTEETPAETEEARDENSDRSEEETGTTVPETDELDPNFSLSFIEALLNGDIQAMALVKADGTTLDLEFTDGYWCNFDYKSLPDIKGIEITAKGETHVILFADLLDEVKTFINIWLDENVSFEKEDPTNLLTKVHVDMQVDVEVEAAKLKLNDGSKVELDPKDNFAIIGDSEIDADSVTALWLMIDGKEYIIDLTGHNVKDGVLTIVVDKKVLGIELHVVTKIDLTIPEGLNLEKAKLIPHDGTKIKLKYEDGLFVLMSEDHIELEQLKALWLKIDGEEYHIDLKADHVKDGVLKIVVDEKMLGIVTNVVTKIDLSIPDGLNLEKAKLILHDGTKIKLKYKDGLFVLMSEDHIELEQLKALWLLIDGKICKIDLDKTNLVDGVLDIDIDHTDLKFHLVTELNLTLPEGLDIEKAKLILKDETTIDLDVSERLSFVLEDIYLHDISALWLKVDGKEYTVDISKADEVEGVLHIDLELDIFFDYVTKLHLDLPEDIDIEEAKLVLADGTFVDLDVTKDWKFIFGEGEFYLQNVTALWLMINGKECLINLSDWNYELSDEGHLSVTIPKELIDLPEVPEEEIEIELLTSIKIHLLEFTGTIDSAVLVYGDDKRLDLEIVDGMLVLNLEDLKIALEDLLHIEVVIDGETYTIVLDEEELTIVDGEVTINTHIDVDVDTDVKEDTDVDVDVDETVTEVNDSDEKPKKSGMLPYTGESSNMLFYLIGMLLTSLGVFTLKKRKLTEE